MQTHPSPHSITKLHVHHKQVQWDTLTTSQAQLDHWLRAHKVVTVFPVILSIFWHSEVSFWVKVWRDKSDLLFPLSSLIWANGRERERTQVLSGEEETSSTCLLNSAEPLPLQAPPPNISPVFILEQPAASNLLLLPSGKTKLHTLAAIIRLWGEGEAWACEVLGGWGLL